MGKTVDDEVKEVADAVETKSPVTQGPAGLVAKELEKSLQSPRPLGGSGAEKGTVLSGGRGDGREDRCAPGTITCQAPLSLGFSRQEHWSGLPPISPPC